jgi:DNA repair exonuclease SbcCD ATPase subunit
MGRLAVRSLSYSGERYYYESPVIGDGVQLLVGPNGVGKTTFSDMIYFCLGGKTEQFGKTGNAPRHKEVMSDGNNFVEMKVEINDEPYLLKRFFGTNDIAVSIGGGARSRCFLQNGLQPIQLRSLTGS